MFPPICAARGGRLWLSGTNLTESIYARTSAFLNLQNAPNDSNAIE